MTTELAPTESDIPYVLSMVLLAISILMYLMHSHRMVGWLVSRLLERFILEDTVLVSIGSIMISPLSGRIMLKDIRYFSRNSSLVVTDGYITINWWGKHCSLKEGNPKVKVHLNGLQWTLYNHVTKYEDIEEMLKRRGEGNEFFQGLQEDSSTTRTRSTDWKPNGEKIVTSFHQKIMNFVGHVSIDVREGTMAFGTPTAKMPFFFNMTFKTMRGKHILDENMCCRDDRIVLDSDFTDVCVKLIKYRADEEGKGVPTAEEPRPVVVQEEVRDTDDAATDIVSDANNTNNTDDRGVVRRIAKVTKNLAAGMKFAFYGDLPDMRPEAAALRQYIVQPEPEQLTQVFGTIIDPSQSACLRLFFFYDVPNVEETAHEKLNHKIEDLPKLGMHMDILSGEINYGPFINLMRSRAQSLFLPWDFRTWGLYKPRDGDWREHSCYEQLITFSSDCNIVIPWRQKKEGFDPPRGLAYSGKNQRMVIKVGKGSRYVYKYPYLQIAKGEGVLTETYFEAKNCVMTTSLTGTEFFRAKHFSFHMDYLYAPEFVFNAMHHVDFILNVVQGEMWYLSDLSTYFSDLATDWGYPWAMYLAEEFKEGWSGTKEFMVKEYMPYMQRVELFLDGFDLHLNANEGNVITDHSTEEGNTIITCRLGKGQVEYLMPNDVFTVAQENEFANTFDIKLSPVEFLLSLSEQHEQNSFIPECFATIENIHLHGTSRCMWPDTNEAQGKPAWVPKRDPPSTWTNTLPRKPKTDTTHEMVDLLTVTLEVEKVTSVLQGWHLKHLGHLASNYGGADSSFVSPKDFARFATLEHVDGRNVRSAFTTYLAATPWKTKEVSLNMSVSSCHVYLPLSQHSVSVFQADAVLMQEASIKEHIHAPPIGVIAKDEHIFVLAVHRGHARVRFNNTVGWVSLDALGPDRTYGAATRRYKNGFAYYAKNPSFWQEEGTGDFIVVSFHDADIGVYTTPTCSDFSVTLSPITVQCPVAGTSDKRSQGPEFFIGIDGLSFNTSSLYGPVPDSLCFSNKIKAQIGNVTGHLLISQMVLIEEIAETLTTHLTYKDIGLRDSIEAVKTPLEQSLWGRSVEISANCTDYQRKLSREGLRMEYDTLDCAEVLTNPWYCEETMASFKAWLDAKEAKEQDASEKAYMTQHVAIESLAMNVKLEHGYFTAACPKGVSLAASTLHDGNTNMRGTVMVPSFVLRLLNCKAGNLLREMEGDHLEVGSVSGAFSVRYSESKSLRTMSSGAVSEGQEAQRMFFQKFDLSNYGLRGIIDIESHQWLPAPDTSVLASKRSPRSRPFYGNDDPSNNNVSPRKRRTVPQQKDQTANPLLKLHLNINDAEEVSHSLEVSPSTAEQKADYTLAVRADTEADLIDTLQGDVGLIDLHTAGASQGERTAPPSPADVSLYELGTPPSAVTPEETPLHTPTHSPLHLFSPMLGTSSNPLETCMSEFSDNSSSSENRARFVDRGSSRKSSLGRRSSFGSFFSGSMPSLRSGGVPASLGSRRKSVPLPTRRRSLDTNRPPRLVDKTLWPTYWDDKRVESSDSSGEDEDAEPFAFTAKGRNSNEWEQGGGAAMSEYASCLQSYKLHVFRGIPKDSALLYGKGHLYGDPVYAHAPHPKVTFEERGKKTTDNVLFRSSSDRAGADTAFAKNLLTPSQAVDTTENQREHTSTYHTHAAFLQPLNVLMTQKAACLVIHGAALHSLWKQDLRSRHPPCKAKPQKGPKQAKPQNKKRGLSFRNKDNKVVFKTENIVSLQLNEMVAICVLGISDEDGEAGAPHTLRCVMHNIQLTHSVRSSGMTRMTSGRHPANTVSLRVGAIGCALQAVQSKSLGKGVDIPDMPHEMRDILIVPEHRLLAIVCILPSASLPSCLLIRGKSEQVPQSSDYLRKYVVHLTNVTVDVVKEALRLRTASTQISFLNFLWKEMQNEDETQSDFDPLPLSAEDTPLQPDASVSCMSYVFVDVDASNIGGDTNRPPTLQRVRCAARKMLFGATEAVIDALDRRKRKTAADTTIDGTFSSVAHLPPIEDDRMSGSGILVERPGDIEMVVIQDDKCLLPDEQDITVSVLRDEDKVSIKEKEDKETHVEKKESTAGLMSWLNDCLAFHLTVHVNQVAGHILTQTTTAMHVEPELDSNSPSGFVVKDINVNLLGNEKSAKTEAQRASLNGMKPVPVTMLMEVGSVAAEVNASISTFFDSKKEETLLPINFEEEQENEKYFPWLYASVVVKTTEFKVLHTVHNYISLVLRNASFMSTNRPHITSRPSNMSASPEYHKHRKTYTDLNETATNLNGSVKPGHRSRISDEQMTTTTPAHGAHSEPLASPRSRAGSMSRKKSVMDALVPKWIVNISIFKKQGTKESATLAYHCRPLKRTGDLYEDPQHIFGITLKALYLSAVIPPWDTTNTIVAHLSADSIRFAIGSHEWLHTEHCLKEWQKLVLRWEAVSSKEPPLEMGSPLQASPCPPPLDLGDEEIKEENQIERPLLSLTANISRAEFDIPLTADRRFVYHMRRVVMSMVEADDSQIVKAQIYPSVMKASEEKEALLPGARITYCTGSHPTLECHIDRVEAVVTKDIINAWVQVYTVIAPEVLRWVEAKVRDEVEPRISVTNATPNTGLFNATVMWAGIRVNVLGETSEVVVSSGMGIARYKRDEKVSEGSFARASTDIAVIEEDDICLGRAFTAPTPGSEPRAQLETMWYIRLPKLSVGLYDLWEHMERLSMPPPEVFDKRRASTINTKKAEQDDGADLAPDRPHLGYRWASAQLSFYAGNCDVESLAMQDTRRARTHAHKKSHSGGMECRLDPHRTSLASLPAVVVDGPPATPTKEKEKEKKVAADKVDVLVANTVMMLRAGAVEQTTEFLKTFTTSLVDFQERIEKDKQQLLEGEALRKLKKEGRKWMKRTVDTMGKTRDPATYISSMVGSFIIKNTSLTIPFGEKMYWSCRSVAVSGAEALLDSIGEDAFPRTLDEPICINDIWKGMSLRPLPTQALQLHLGEASVATLVERDDVSPDDVEEQPKKAVVLCKARDVAMFFSDGQPLPSLWIRERGGRVDPKAGWHRQFGTNFAHILGGKGVFLPASRELTSSALRSRCGIREISLRARARVWSESITPLMVTYEVSGPEVRIAPNILSCIKDLADDFIPSPEVADSLAVHDPTLDLSPRRGQPSLSPSRMSESTKRELSLEMDLVGKVEAGTISVHSDENLPAAFRQVSKEVSSIKAQDVNHTTIFKLPIPSIDLRATVKIPTEIDEATGVTQTITASILASLPPNQDRITINPTAVYFTNELSLWQRSWLGRKAQWHSTIESHVEGLHEMLKDGLMSAQLGSVKVAGTPFTLSSIADGQDPSGTVYLNHLKLIDVLIPMPVALVDYSGCKEGCRAEHTGLCAKCGKGWADHEDHMCETGGRGVWRRSQTMEPPVMKPKARVTKLRSDLVQPRGSLVFKQILVKTMFEPFRSSVLRVDAVSTTEELLVACRSALQVTMCWRLDIRGPDKARVVLRYDDVIDGETYSVDLVGAQVVLSLRVKPFVVLATTAPISECAAVIETGMVDLTLIRTPKGRGANMSVILSTQPLLSTGCAFRVAVKDRHHECMSISVAGLTVLYNPSFTKKCVVHFSKAPSGMGDLPALRFTERIGHLKSFFIVYKLWKKKSDEAMTELMKHTSSDKDVQSQDFCSLLPKDDCTSQGGMFHFRHSIHLTQPQLDKQR